MNIKINNKELVKTVIKLYVEEEKFLLDVAKIVNLSHVTCSKILKNNGIKTRRENKNNQKWIVNQDFFKKIDTEEKAYWLGFIYADGNVYLGKTDNNKYNSTFNFNLKKDDEKIVEKLKNSIEASQPITYKNKNKKYQDAAVLTICNKEFCQNLINLGCVPAKSLILKFPTEEQVPKNLLSHFIRGYFDGDGCVFLNKTQIPKSGIISSFDFLISVQKILSDIGIKSSIRKTRSKAFSLNICGFKDSLRFAAFIYKDKSDFFLPRKYIKFLQGLNNPRILKFSKEENIIL